MEKKRLSAEEGGKEVVSHINTALIEKDVVVVERLR